MTYLKHLPLVLILAGCAAPLTPDERAQRHVQRVDKMIDTYGPACERLGLAPASKPWADCVVLLEEEEKADAAAARARRSRNTSTTCLKTGPLLNCD